MTARLTGLAARINAALPQTQCTRCGYPDCAAYAQAIADGAAAINQCPPGGAGGVARLAALTGQSILPLNPAHGLEAARSMAFIDENACIGCTLCLKACPTDAIVGASKRMHTIIEAHCTGCELCLPVCPVDCIQLENASGTATGWAAWSAQQAENARERHTARQRRLAQKSTQGTAPMPGSATTQKTAFPSTPSPEARQAAIAAAMERARQKRAPAAR